MDNGKWTVKSTLDAVVFTHEVTDPSSGYAYLYRKTVRLTPGKAQLVLEHSLSNTGRKVIDTSVYDHNFFMIDGRPIGPDVSIRFPFALKAARSMAPLADVRGSQIAYLRELQQGEIASTPLEGFGTSPADYDIRVENTGAGAGVRITADRPLSRIVFWSIRTTACAGPFIEGHIEPGHEFTWRTTYDFYTIGQR